MTAINIQVDTRRMDRELRRLEARVRDLNGRALPRLQARALNRAGAWARTRVRRELARVKGLPQAVIAKRISHYAATPAKPIARVWIGTKRKIPLAVVPGARTVLQGREAGSLKAGRVSVRPFKVRLKSGKVAQMVRVEPGARRTAGRPASSPPNLPIEEPAIRLMPQAQPILEAQARAAMGAPFVNELRRLLVRALKV